MIVKDIIKLIENDGWSMLPRNASEHRHPTKNGRITVAGQLGDDLNKGIEKSIRKQRKFDIVARFESGTNKWSAYLLDVPGCVATGIDRLGTTANLVSALQLRLEGMIKDGYPLPLPQTKSISSG